MKINIPGFGQLEIQSLVLDYNGTIATDGKLISGVKERLVGISESINIFVLTADTNRTVQRECRDLPLSVEIIGQHLQADEKARFIENLQGNTVVIGNGRNDEKMFLKATIAIAVIGEEGCYTKTLYNSDIVVKSINDALDLLLKNERLVPTLRN